MRAVLAMKTAPTSAPSGDTAGRLHHRPASLGPGASHLTNTQHVLSIEDPNESGGAVMNAVDVMLQDELGRLMDRLAATVPGGSLEATSATNPALRTRLDDMEVSLAAARVALLEDYGRWRRMLDDLENVWA